MAVNPRLVFCTNVKNVASLSVLCNVNFENPNILQRLNGLEMIALKLEVYTILYLESMTTVKLLQGVRFNEITSKQIRKCNGFLNTSACAQSCDIIQNGKIASTNFCMFAYCESKCKKNCTNYNY
jgi:hypothetical protein